MGRSLVLLTVFTVGGLLLPVAHQFSHLDDRSPRTSETEREPVDRHTRGSHAWLDVDAGRSIDVNCELCARLALSILLLDASRQTLAIGLDAFPVTSDAAKDYAPESYPIRGPPAVV